MIANVTVRAGAIRPTTNLNRTTTPISPVCNFNSMCSHRPNRDTPRATATRTKFLKPLPPGPGPRSRGGGIRAVRLVQLDAIWAVRAALAGLGAGGVPEAEFIILGRTAPISLSLATPLSGYPPASARSTLLAPPASAGTTPPPQDPSQGRGRDVALPARARRHVRLPPPRGARPTPLVIYALPIPAIALSLAPQIRRPICLRSRR
jgi:hypothetical protein